jgi:hypothetical protein
MYVKRKRNDEERMDETDPKAEWDDKKETGMEDHSCRDHL